MTPRHLRLNPPQQRRGISCHAGAVRKDSRIVSGHLVDDGQSGVDAGAVLCIDVPVDDGGEDDARRLLQCDEGAAPGGCVGRAVRATDRNQPTTRIMTSEGRGDMAQASVLHSPLDLPHYEIGSASWRETMLQYV